MSNLEAIKDFENDARELRLSEQAVFRNVLENKQKKSRKLLMWVTGSFVLAVSGWVLFHCLPLMRGT